MRWVAGRFRLHLRDWLGRSCRRRRDGPAVLAAFGANSKARSALAVLNYRSMAVMRRGRLFVASLVVLEF